jgi:outer membrane protein TolC
VKNKKNKFECKPHYFIFFVVVTLFARSSSLARAESTPITLELYLGQVQGSNQGYQGEAITQHADLEAAQESTLPFSPQFFTNLQYTDDHRQTLVPLFEGTRTVTDSSQFGLKKLFDFGLQSQIYYGITSTTLYGVSPALVPESSLVTTGLTFTLTQSLWQNGFGKQDQAIQRSVEAQDLANAYSNAYQTKTTLSDAESRYWTLAIARELIIVQKASADRTVAIRDFNARRVRSHLIDESDLLTSDAQAKSKQFDLKSAIDNERVAARSFNSARGIDSDQVQDNLVLPDADGMQSIDIPHRAPMRDDVKSAEQSELAITANSEAAIQRQLPTLNVIGTVSTNGLDPSLGQSMIDTVTTQYPYYSIGLNLNVPLDFSTVSSVKRAYAEQMKGAELIYYRRLFDQENDWKDLVKRFQEAKERLSIAIDVEKAQKLKFQREEVRQKQGVTTTYQVFQFEIDYLTAELNRIQTQATILSLVAQMKTYQSDSQENPGKTL